MFKLSTLFLYAFLLIPKVGKAQKSNYNKVESECPLLPFSYLLDSVSRKISVDSIATILPGNWHLVEIKSTSYIPEKVRQQVDLVIDKKGECKVYQNGHQTSYYNFMLSRGLQKIYYTFKETGKQPFFQILHNKGFLLVCNNNLHIYSTRSDETEYKFVRSSNK